MEDYKTEKWFLSKISNRTTSFEFVDDSDLLKLLSEHTKHLIDTSEMITADNIKGIVNLIIESKTKREQRLKIVGDEYYDKSSNHYLDNERFSWAVNSINSTFDEDELNIIKTSGEMVPAEKWINVNNKLPNNRTYVVVHWTCGYDIAEYKHGCFFTGLDKITGVTHWQEITTPGEHNTKS